MGVWDGAALAVTEVAPSPDSASEFAFAPLLGEEVDLDLPVLDAVGTTPDTDERDDAVRAQTDRGAALHSAQVRAGDAAAHVVSAADVDAVEVALRPLLRGTLVVVPNSWARAELDAVQQILSEEEEEAGLFMSGEGLDPLGHYRASGWVRRSHRALQRVAPNPGKNLVLDDDAGMGFLDRLLGRTAPRTNDAASKEEPSAGSPSAHRVRLRVNLSTTIELGVVQLTGTTTFAREAITALASRHGAADGGYIETSGSLQREPDNRADPFAVGVHVEGERIGYLPSFIAQELELSDDGSEVVEVQIFTELLPAGLRAEAWVWLGDGPSRWQWSPSNRPPLSSPAKAAAHHQSSRNMVEEALAGGGARAKDFQRGMVNGVHYLELVEPIKQLKREGRLDEALVLCTAAIAGAEGSREGREPAPWYTEQAAIIYRKLGRRDDEIAVLQRWLKLCPKEHRDGTRIGERLAKLTA